MNQTLAVRHVTVTLLPQTRATLVIPTPIALRKLNSLLKPSGLLSDSEYASEREAVMGMG